MFYQLISIGPFKTKQASSDNNNTNNDNTDNNHSDNSNDSNDNNDNNDNNKCHKHLTIYIYIWSYTHIGVYIYIERERLIERQIDRCKAPDRPSRALPGNTYVATQYQQQ